MTLLELLLVMMILSLVLGAGMGMFTALDLGQRQALGLVRSALRSAQGAAATGRAPARVRLFPERGALRVEAFEVVGTWHFEDASLAGAYGLDGSMTDADLIEDGFLGRALSFARGPVGARAEFPLPADASFDLAGGFRIACAVRLERDGGGPLVTLGESCGLILNAAGRVRGWFQRMEEDERGELFKGARVTVEAEPGAVPFRRWTRVELVYDLARLRLVVDGVPLAEVEEVGAVWPLAGALVLSDRAQRFPGSIDSLVIATAPGRDEVRLPEGVGFAPGTPAGIWFDAEGRLDRGHHAAPVALELVYDDGARKLVGVGMYGTVQ